MTADDSRRQPPPGGPEQATGTRPGPWSRLGDRLGRAGRRALVIVLVLVGAVLAVLLGQYLFANAWTTHVTRTVNHSTFTGFWYGGWFAFVSVLLAAVLVRLAFVRRLPRADRGGGAGVGPGGRGAGVFTIGVALSGCPPGAHGGPTPNDG